MPSAFSSAAEPLLRKPAAPEERPRAETFLFHILFIAIGLSYVAFLGETCAENSLEAPIAYLGFMTLNLLYLLAGHVWRNDGLLFAGVACLDLAIVVDLSCLRGWGLKYAGWWIATDVLVLQRIV